MGKKIEQPIQIRFDTKDISDNILSYLIEITGLFAAHGDLEDKISRPNITKYIKNGRRNNSKFDNKSIQINIPKLDIGAIAIPWDTLLENINTSLALACAAGGYKVLIDLLKLWVEKNNNRVIKIQKGDSSMELRGHVSQEQLDRIIQVFEEKFPNTCILSTDNPNAENILEKNNDD